MWNWTPRNQITLPGPQGMNGTVEEKTPLLSPNSYMFHPVDWKKKKKRKRSLLRTIWGKKKKKDRKVPDLCFFFLNKTPLTREPLVPHKSSFPPNQPLTLLRCTLPYPDAPTALSHWWRWSRDEFEATRAHSESRPSAHSPSSPSCWCFWVSKLSKADENKGLRNETYSRSTSQIWNKCSLKCA